MAKTLYITCIHIELSSDIDLGVAPTIFDPFSAFFGKIFIFVIFPPVFLIFCSVFAYFLSLLSLRGPSQ